MGFARLNVWVHDVQDPCRISDQTWRINITDCQNRVVTYCGRRYANLPARCGHTELRLPPGCYIVWGALGVAIRPPFLYANYVTHFAFVTVRCDETACVHLYAPSYKKCWRAFLLATHLIAQQQGFRDVRREELAEFERLGERLAGEADAAGGDEVFADQLKELPEILREKIPEDEGTDKA